MTTLTMWHVFNGNSRLCYVSLAQHCDHLPAPYLFGSSCVCPLHLIIICVLWLVFAAFSSIAISTVNHADSRASLASLDSNPSTNEKSSEKTDNCEKVGLLSQYAAPGESAASHSTSTLLGSSTSRSLDPCL